MNNLLIFLLPFLQLECILVAILYFVFYFYHFVQEKP